MAPGICRVRHSARIVTQAFRLCAVYQTSSLVAETAEYSSSKMPKLHAGGTPAQGTPDILPHLHSQPCCQMVRKGVD